MLTGTTSTGFEWKLEDDALDDMELLDARADWDRGKETGAIHACRLLLGEQQRAALYDHLRGDNGRVKATAVLNAVTEILTALREGKKS